MDTSLAGKLLVATPDLTDDLFARSVVLVLQHDDETAEGVILNRPLDTPVDDVLPGWQSGASAPQRVFQGGPVQLDSAIGIAGLPGDQEPPPGIKRLFGAISLVDLDAGTIELVGRDGLERDRRVLFDAAEGSGTRACFATGQPLISEDVRTDPRVNAKVLADLQDAST